MTATALPTAAPASTYVEAAPAAPIILVTTAHPSLHQHPGPAGEPVHPGLGRLLQPRHLSSVELTAEAGIPWACDNDCFQGLKPEAFVKMLDRVTGLPGCLFVTVPDVVGDAAATLEAFETWAPELERRGLPLGLVAQDGMTVADLEARAPRLAALFIGGSTEWKEGAEAAELAIAAKTLGLWVHWGRVNTRRRFDLIVATGAADSFDGSKWARFRKTYLDGGLEWIAAATLTRTWALETLERQTADQEAIAAMPDQLTDAQVLAADVETLSLADVFRRHDLGEQRTAATIARLECELAILDAFDWRRGAAGHDYGNGQRASELSRRRGELERLGGSTEPGIAGMALEHADELTAAWRRIGQPRLARIAREDFRRSTPATSRTVKAWERTRQELVRAGIEA